MPTFASADFDRVRNAALEMIEQHHIPGMNIAIVDGDDLIFSEGFGYADIETKEPMTPDRRQRIASITKTMVGLCLMAAVDDSKLGLDDRLVELLPDVRFDGPASGMTLKHLLTHTSGIGEAPTVARLRDVANPDRLAVTKPGDFTSLYPDGVTVEVEPGSKWAYCNNGYAMLGEVITRAEKASLQDVMQRRIWGPLGMTSTDILDENDARITSCYHRAPNEDARFQLERAGVTIKDEPTVDGLNIRGSFTAEFNQGMRAAGGVQSSSPTWQRTPRRSSARGAGIVRPETFASMTSAAVGNDPRLIAWGLSFARTPLRTSDTTPSKWPIMLGHGGAYFGGWNSHLDVLPGRGLAVIQHMNVMLDEPAPIFNRIIRAVLDVAEPAFPDRAIDREILEAAPGIYELPMPGPLTNFRPQTRIGRVHVERDGDGLKITSRFGSWKDGARLKPADPDDPAFFVIERDSGGPAYLAFDRASDGSIIGLHRDEMVYMPKRRDA